MQPYRVSHRTSGEYFYVLAKSSTEAVERVTLQIADVEGSAAWTCSPATPPTSLVTGVVVDRDGKPIRTMMAWRLSGFGRSPKVDVMTDFHGDLTDPELVLFGGGNYFFAMAPLVKAFEAENPEYKGKLLWETIPPGLLVEQMDSGGTITSGNMTFTVKLLGRPWSRHRATGSPCQRGGSLAALMSDCSSRRTATSACRLPVAFSATRRAMW